MATSDQATESDPITTALPPASDYITYLTILEYQLTPERLPVLTKHLAEDDGTLAKEIGWDLVKLILPFLDAAPKAGMQCLEVVSRRGNPREVIVRVAEALESLGADDDGTESGLDEAPGADELPTFQGEAQRIHLGRMELQGLPPSSGEKGASGTIPTPQQREDGSTDSNIFEVQFSTLLSMLGILHARIKTQYPSRFLATSLPAALGAYRRIAITSATTIAFVNLLGKLSGRQRPTLPPRSSTASTANLIPAATPGTEVYAPLPDPEGQSKENTTTPSDEEMKIVLRLLQAVTLEVLEEFLLADPSTMEWSTRLLERQSPNRAIPSRKSRSKAWQDDEDLKSRGRLMEKFLGLAKDLRLDPEDVFRSTNLPLVQDQSPQDEIKNDEDEQASDYPTSPSQIPYSHLGALFLYLASRVPALVYSAEPMPPLDIPAPDLHHFVNQFVVPTPTPMTEQLIPSVTHNPPAAIDSLLALLLTITRQYSSGSPSESDENADHRSLINILSYLSAQHSDPCFRAAAHQLATNLIHDHPSSTFRLTTIKSTITDCGAFDSLKEVAINWLKEEILFTVHAGTPTSSHSEGEAALPEPSTNDKENIFASPALFSDDETLTSLIFPTTSPPPSPNPNDEPAPADPTPQTFPIASLNLLFLLLTNPTLKARYNLAPKIISLKSSATTTTTTTTTTTQPSNTLESTTLRFLTAMQKHLDDNAGKGTKEEEGKLGLLGLAVGRVVGALEGP